MTASSLVQMFTVDGIANPISEQKLFARPYVYVGKWIGFSWNHLFMYAHDDENGGVAITLPADARPAVEEHPDFAWMRDRPPGGARHAYPREDTDIDATDNNERMLADLGQWCLDNCFTWNAFRIDPTTHVVTLALNYQRTLCCTVDLFHFVMHRLWLSSWQRVEGFVCTAIDPSAAEDGERHAGRYGWTHHIHWEEKTLDGIAYQREQFTHERIRDSNRDGFPPPLEAIPAVEEQIWLHLEAVITRRVFYHTHLNTKIIHEDGNPLNFRDNNLKEKKGVLQESGVRFKHSRTKRKQYAVELRQVDPCYRHLLASVNNRKSIIRKYSVSKDFGREIAQIRAMRTAAAFGYTWNWLTVFPYTEKELRRQNTGQKGPAELYQARPYVTTEKEWDRWLSLQTIKTGIIYPPARMGRG